MAYFSAFFVQHLAFLFKGISWPMMATEAPVLCLQSRRKEKKKRKKGYTSYLTWFGSRVSGSCTSYSQFFDQNLVCGLIKLQGHLGNVIFFSFIFISWRLITSQHCSGFCHTLTWISHGVTCNPHPNPPSDLPLHPIPLGLPSAPGPSTCLIHPTWAGDPFHYR